MKRIMVPLLRFISVLVAGVWLVYVPLETRAQIYSDFDMQLKWQTERYTGENDPYTHGRSTPLVGDVDGDGDVEVVVPWSTLSAGLSNQSLRPNQFLTKNLNVINGKTGEQKYLIQTCDYSIHGQSIAIADVNKDGKSEIFIVAIGPRLSSSQQLYGGKYIYCYDGSKANNGPEDYIWKSEDTVDYSFIPYIADMNNDGVAELVVGGNIYNAITGNLLVKGHMVDTGMGFGGPHNVHGSWQQTKPAETGEQYYMFAVADIDGDNQLEICAGNTVYKPAINNSLGTSGNQFEILRQCESSLPYDDMYDGQTFVIDFDNDGDLDVCVLGRNNRSIGSNFSGDVNHVGLYVWEGQTSEMIGYFVCDPKVNSPSIPSAGDIDGDGYPEVIFNGWVFGQNYGAANNPDQMHVFKYEKGYTQDDRCKAMNIKEPFTRAQTQEFFESAGFTVFDFNQDTKAEIVFRGEKSLYILDGSTLTKLCDPVAVTSGTTAEYPVVADVDQDGHADIIVTEEYNPSYGPGGCVSVFESATPGAWGPARRVWNQWPYNVVNINEDMTVPQYVFNIATQNADGRKPFNAFLQQQISEHSARDSAISVSGEIGGFNSDLDFLDEAGLIARFPRLSVAGEKLYYAPTVSTDSIDVSATSVKVYGNVLFNGWCDTVIEKGFIIKNNTKSSITTRIISHNQPFIQCDSLCDENAFSISMNNLPFNTTYYVCAYAANGVGTRYGNEIAFTTPSNPNDGISCIGTPVLTDINGNVYNTVQIGNQCWMKENLRATKYADTTNTKTIIAAWHFSSATELIATHGIVVNKGVSLVSNSMTSDLNYAAGTASIWCNGWNYETGVEKYWLIGPISFEGFTSDLTIQYEAWGSKQSPKTFFNEVKIGVDGEWQRIDSCDLTTVSYSVVGPINLPSAILANQKEVYFRFRVSDESTSIDGSTIGESATSRLAEIIIQGATPPSFNYNNDIAYYYYPNNDSANVATYGLLYDWHTMMKGFPSSNANPSGVQGVCPTGWHVPSDAEWTQLEDYVSSQNYGCGKISSYIAKALASTTGWNISTNTCAVGNDQAGNNTLGFSAVSTGTRDSYFGVRANFWSATGNGSANAYYRYLQYSNGNVYKGIESTRRDHGLSVRCLRDTASNSGGGESGQATHNVETDTACDSYTWHDIEYTESGTYIYEYENDEGYASADTLHLTIKNCDGEPCHNAVTLTDIDGNTYNTLQIGEQCWMKENLKTTKYADGTAIFQGSTTSYDTPYWYYPNNDSINKAVYGLLYNWKAVMGNSSSSSSNPSAVQGICPTGWHVPNDAEWTQLTDYVSSQSEYRCNSSSHNIGKSLASAIGWKTYIGTCLVGNDQVGNNATGFSAVPAGIYDGSFDYFGGSAPFWSATGSGSSNAYYRRLGYRGVSMYREDGYKYYGLSVRCLRD